MPEPVEPPDGGDKPKLEDLISGLDDDAKAAVLAELRMSRVEAKTAKDKLAQAESAAQAEAARLRQASMTADERATDIAKQSDAKVSKLFRTLATAEIKAAAAGKFADVDDALTNLDAAKYVNEDGDVNTTGIKADLDELLSRKPHLAAKRGPKPDPTQGNGSGGGALSPSDSFAGWFKSQLK